MYKGRSQTVCGSNDIAFSPICEPGIGEALGLSYAIQWAYELQLTNVDFEMDAKRVVDYYNKGSDDISEFGAIIDDCRRRRCY